MPFMQSIVVEGLRGIVGLVVSMFAAEDRRTVVLERRARALRLFKELAAAGLRPRDLKAIDRTLTDED